LPRLVSGKGPPTQKCCSSCNSSGSGMGRRRVHTLRRQSSTTCCSSCTSRRGGQG
jgi:hypothetical protein